MKKRWPSDEVVKRVVRHLEKDLGLSVYGGNVDLKTGQEFTACRDFNARDVVKYRKMLLTNKLWKQDDEN